MHSKLVVAVVADCWWIAAFRGERSLTSVISLTFEPWISCCACCCCWRSLFLQLLVVALLLRVHPECFCCVAATGASRVLLLLAGCCGLLLVNLGVHFWTVHHRCRVKITGTWFLFPFLYILKTDLCFVITLSVDVSVLV